MQDFIEMRLKSRSFFIIWIVIAGWLLSACTTADSIYPLNIRVRQPTSIFVELRTPVPTSTPTRIPTPTITPTPNNDPDYYISGIGLVVTLDNLGQIIEINKRERFLLQLGTDYIWSVIFEPPEIVSQNLKITPEIGEQGVFIARERGSATLKATGAPVCRQAAPPCELPDVLFQARIVVK